jgi:hypothetical protein
MSERESPRWLNEVSDELRRDVPVRAAWRARLLDEIEQAPPPSATDDVDVRFDDVAVTGHERARRPRSIVLTPVAGLAAAVLFTALGAGLMYTALSRRADTRDTVAGAESLTTPASTSAAGSVVRFELAAPQAARVALVGSFNDWNPRATPLVRETATGKWAVSLRLAPGRHVYAFVVDGDVTADPSAPRAADDDFGSANSVVFVSSPST